LDSARERLVGDAIAVARRAAEVGEHRRVVLLEQRFHRGHYALVHHLTRWS